MQAVTASFKNSELEEIDAIANLNRKSRAWVIKRAVQEMLTREDVHESETRKGIADVKAGRVYNHNDVVKWARNRMAGKSSPKPRYKS